jgi:hypothetical protein
MVKARFAGMMPLVRFLPVYRQIYKATMRSKFDFIRAMGNDGILTGI